MIHSVVEELEQLHAAQLDHLIPSFLNGQFKTDLNERIIPNSLSDFERLIQTKTSSGSALSIDETHDSQFELISEITNGLCELLLRYNAEIALYVSLFQNENNFNKCADFFNSENELLTYQRTIFIQKLEIKHYNLLKLLFRQVFDYYHKLNNPDDSDETESENDRQELHYQKSQILIEKFHQINQLLFELQLFDHMCGDIVIEVVEQKIRKYIETISIDNYQVSFVKSFEQWLEQIIIGWIKLIYSSSNFKNFPSKAKFDEYFFNYKKQLAHFMYTNYAHVRIRRLFDIIIDFPDSRSAVEDLKVCLDKTNLRAHVIRSLTSSIEHRLLHPGVNTSDILTAYVSAIKALLCLDASGVMMENVCEPLKRYLRQRDDTVKCIVSNLTDDGESSSDLMEEFCKDLYTYDGAGADGIDSNMAVLNNSSDQMSSAVTASATANAAGTAGTTVASGRPRAWKMWLPDPIDASSGGGGGGGGTSGGSSSLGSKSNIISMLVNIYGSKDMFVNEYKTLLADRLLSNYSYNMEKEIRNLELLKLRFGDSNLFACEAMLKDIGESKRINSNILEQLRHQRVTQIGSFAVDANALKCIILSEQFWPKLKEEKIEMPAELKLIQEKFMSSYEAFKGNRTLIWKNTLGQVSIEVELNKQVMEFSVTPIQAAVIIKFQEQDTWSLLELSQSLRMCSFALRKKLFFWKVQGLIREVTHDQSNNGKMNQSNQQQQQPQQPDANSDNNNSANAANEIYTLVKDSGKLNKSKAVFEDYEDSEKAAKSNGVLKEQELTLYWNYTQSMLRGCGCLALDRIHTWLKLYANPDLTIEQVKYLVDFKIKEQLLKYHGGFYRLNK